MTSSAPAEPGVVDVLEILPTYVDEVVLRTVRDTHRAWADRVTGVVNRSTDGAAVAPKRLHDGISETVYATIGLGLRAASLTARAAGGRGPRLAGPRGRTTWSALNGLLGDRFADEGSRLAITMAVRRAAADVPLDPASVRAAFPAATGRVVIFLHGLGEHEEHWSTRRAEVGTTYAETLAAQGWTPVLLRVNTGLSLRENGVALCGLVQDLVDSWPVHVERVALVGHSMGGLIAQPAARSRTGHSVRGATW